MIYTFDVPEMLNNEDFLQLIQDQGAKQKFTGKLQKITYDRKTFMKCITNFNRNRNKGELITTQEQHLKDYLA